MAILAASLSRHLGISSLWDRHALNIGPTCVRRSYRSFPRLNQTDANLHMRGRIDLWHDAAILTNFRVASLHEGVGSLTSPTGAVEPTPYSLRIGRRYLLATNRPSWRLVRRASDSYDYGSTRAQDGTIINQDSRDGHVHVAHGRVDYAISPDFGVFSSFEVNRRDLRGTPTQPLSSDGYRSLTGINVQLSHWSVGEFAAGYASQRFDDPGIGTIAGPSYRASYTGVQHECWTSMCKPNRSSRRPSDTVASGIRAERVSDRSRLRVAPRHRASVAGTYERDKFFGQSRDDTCIRHKRPKITDSIDTATSPPVPIFPARQQCSVIQLRQASRLD